MTHINSEFALKNGKGVVLTDTTAATFTSAFGEEMQEEQREVKQQKESLPEGGRRAWMAVVGV